MAFIVGDERKAKAGSMDLLNVPGSFESVQSAQQKAAQPDQIQRRFQTPAASPQDKKKKKQKFQVGGTVEDEELEEEEEGVALPISGGISGVPIGAAPVGPAPTTADGAGAQIGGFANIQQYLEANIPKVEQITGEIAGGIQQEAEQLRTGLGETREEYLGQAGRFGEEAKGFIGQQLEQAGTQAQTQEEQERFQTFRTGGEAAPMFDVERQQATALESRAREIARPGGRFAELERIVGRQAPQYTGGQRTLDQLLLASTPGYGEAIKGIRQATRGLGEQVGQLGQEIGAARTARQQEAQLGVEEARTGLRGTVEQRYEGLRGAIESGEYTPEQLELLGITKGQRTYGADIAGALGRTRGMTPEEAARLDALAGLGGLGGRSTFAGIEGGDIGADVASQIAGQKTAYEQALAPAHAQRATEQAKLDQMVRNKWHQKPMLKGKFYRQVQERDQARARQAAIESQYGARVEDGGIISNPRIEALKKMRDN